MVVRTALLAMMGLVLGTVARPACADPGFYVITPYDHAGKVTVDLRYWTVRNSGRPEVVWPEIGLGYGVNSRWTTAWYASFVGSHDSAVVRSRDYWQNDVLLTQGEWPFDVALHLQWNRDRGALQRHSIEAGPVFQTDVGRTQLNANLIVEHFTGAAAATPTQLKYQWMVRHRAFPGLHLGAQGFGELGPWRDWSASDHQSHRLGPAVFGDVYLEAGRVVHWQAAYLGGKTYGRSGQMFTGRVALEF